MGRATGRSSPWAALADRLRGDLLTDEVSRRLYASDASIYEELPAAVARPRDRDDCVALVEHAIRFGVPLIARGAGTSLAGQCVGSGLVVDTSRYMDRIIEIDPEARTATLEPGVVPTRLNTELATHGLRFAPHPSTADRCTLGGMLGNNAWGTHVLRDGTTREKVIAVEAVLADGALAELRALGQQALETKLALEGVEGDAYRDILLTLTHHLEAVHERFPGAGGPLNNGGYPLDVLASMQPWEPDGPALNLAPLLAGSEGTLALVTRITVSLDPLPPQGVLVCPRFADVETALRSVPLARGRGAVAVELLDAHVLELAEPGSVEAAGLGWGPGQEGAVLLIELEDSDDEARSERARALASAMRDQPGCAGCLIVQGAAIEAAWALRRSGLGLLMGRAGPLRAVTGLEDASVPVEQLPILWSRIRERCEARGIELVAYGPVSVGVIHLRPLLALEEVRDRRAYETLMNEFAGIVHGLGGYFTAKHGDGRMRGRYLPERFGPGVAAAFADVKAAFDPRGLFNPGKILEPPALTEALRYRSLPEGDLHPALDWSSRNGIVQAAQQCHGAGVCLRAAGGVMCPSYRATRDELHGVRGRANLLRQVITGAPDRGSLADPALEQALALCVSCKACRRECPAGVDVAALKAEFLDAWHSRHGVPLHVRLWSALPELGAVASRWPALANRIAATEVVKRLLGTDPDRSLPRFAAERFSRWWGRRPRPCVQGRPVALLIDPLTELFEPQIGRAAVRVLERLGFSVRPIGPISMGRIEIGLGLLAAARRRAEAAIERLAPALDDRMPLVGLEPSELLTLRDEMPGLLEDRAARERCREIAARARLWQELVVDEDLEGAVDGPNEELEVRLHVHCHERALIGPTVALDAVARLPGVRPVLLESGCCGMAGAFGYRRGNAEISRRIGEQGPLPGVRAAPEDAVIVASGSSCRQQIRLETGRETLHPVELWDGTLKG
jgi:FAD/FMN-containing dehydrogenase/Fe-S oxidoreductase